MTTTPDGASFVDTNVLVYALDAGRDRRTAIAQDLIRRLMQADALRTSTQVLQELFVVLTRKARNPIDPAAALRYMDQIAAWPVSVLDYSAIRDAANVAQTARLSFWDSLILVAAARAGARRIYTEDLNHGQIIRGVEIVNPFLDPGFSPAAAL